MEITYILYTKDKSILKNDFEAWDTQGLYVECVKELPVNCFLIKLKESIYEEDGEEYKEQLNTTKQDIFQLSSKIKKWTTAHQLWIKGIDKCGIEDISEKYVGNMLVELSSIISSI